MILSLQSDVVPRRSCTTWRRPSSRRNWRRCEGVGQVNVGGSSLPAVRVELNPQPVSGYNIGLDQIASFLGSANANRPKGDSRHGHDAAAIDRRTSCSRRKITRIWSCVYRNGAPVRLSDLGRVFDSVEDVRNIGLATASPPC